MFLYLIIFFIASVIFGMGYGIADKSVKLLIGMLASLCIFVGIADMLGGYDRYIYGEIFDYIADVTDIGANYWDTGCFDFFPGERGWTLVNIGISFITSNRYIFILTITIIVYTLLFFSLKKYTDNYPLAVILFLGLWFFFSFTYLRQVLGATTAWLAIRYVIDRKIWIFLLVIFIAYNIHKSAIIFLPLYFIPIRKFSANFVVIFMFFMLVFGITPLPDMLFDAYGGIDNIQSKLTTYQLEGSFRFDYVIEAIFFLFIIIRNYDRISGNDKEKIVLLNMALIFCAILLFFTRSQNGGRLSWYYMIGMISTLCYLGSRGKKQISELGTVLVILCFLLFFRIVSLWGILLSPYKTFFTDGHREGDVVYEKFEYDENYDDDKFYR